MPRRPLPRTGALHLRPRVNPRLRTAIINAYRRRCALCDRSGYVAGLDVHHITARGMGGSGTRRDYPANLIALCRSCHDEVHQRMNRWAPRLRSIAERVALRISTPTHE